MVAMRSGDDGELVADCRLRLATDIFRHTWDVVVLAALDAGPRRRRALRRSIGGISDKVLTDALNRLLSTGLIERRHLAEAPPRVDYALTALGRSFADGPMRALGTWVTEYGDELSELQEGYR
ncbi:winged helix-turn-helix transcriptional regulator [Cryptosporangium phraense]|uniref:Helix-turn-helix transcriptional regulator n=1 Tax=Cryptosporangium phraense TaxID=2593070 RepID=A0A545AS12_9ACTN|nr:helix-turn-helix transcriptional regulator [Cryptosporangium phraense]